MVLDSCFISFSIHFTFHFQKSKWFSWVSNVGMSLRGAECSMSRSFHCRGELEFKILKVPFIFDLLLPLGLSTECVMRELHNSIAITVILMTYSCFWVCICLSCLYYWVMLSFYVHEFDGCSFGRWCLLWVVFWVKIKEGSPPQLVFSLYCTSCTNIKF